MADKVATVGLSSLQEYAGLSESQETTFIEL